MKRLLFLLVGAAVGVAAWLRLRRGEDTFEEMGQEVPSAPGQLGGEVDPELLAILACPLDKAPVSREGDYIVCSECGRRYPIRDGIPVMLIEEAVLPETPPASESPAPAAVNAAPAATEETSPATSDAAGEDEKKPSES